MRTIRFILAGCLTIALAGLAHAAPPDVCGKFKLDPLASLPLNEVKLPMPGACKPQMSHGYPLPDPACSPGAVNPTVTAEILQTKGFTTKCLRDQATTAGAKAKTYDWYGLKKPKNNTGKTQTCELDHIISIELGGADTLENLWPQCGPARTTLAKRYFKIKDAVENYLAREVKAGRMNLADAQHGIATDWTQYIAKARAK